MNYELREESGIRVAGISARVSNTTPELIGDLWRSFHANGGPTAIEGRLTDVVYSVYCQYEGDYTKPYTVLIGCAVDAGDLGSYDEDMEIIDVAAGSYSVFEVKGELPQGVFRAWSEIWAKPLKRRYKTDYDRYATDGAVTIHVGVR